MQQPPHAALAQPDEKEISSASRNMHAAWQTIESTAGTSHDQPLAARQYLSSSSCTSQLTAPLLSSMSSSSMSTSSDSGPTFSIAWIMLCSFCEVRSVSPATSTRTPSVGSVPSACIFLSSTNAGSVSSCTTKTNSTAPAYPCRLTCEIQLVAELGWVPLTGSTKAI
tara:strand:+ start:4067 stop:4567 length:501 start_codon:yes stop_codon:yes gene_type:complete